MQKQPFFKYISCKNLFNKSFTEIQASSNAINNLLKIIVFSLENIENSQIFQFNGQKLSQRKSCRYPRDKHKNLRFYEKCNYQSPGRSEMVQYYCSLHFELSTGFSPILWGGGHVEGWWVPPHIWTWVTAPQWTSTCHDQLTHDTRLC